MFEIYRTNENQTAPASEASLREIEEAKDAITEFRLAATTDKMKADAMQSLVSAAMKAGSSMNM